MKKIERLAWCRGNFARSNELLKKKGDNQFVAAFYGFNGGNSLWDASFSVTILRGEAQIVKETAGSGTDRRDVEGFLVPLSSVVVVETAQKYDCPSQGRNREIEGEVLLFTMKGGWRRVRYYSSY